MKKLHNLLVQCVWDKNYVIVENVLNKLSNIKFIQYISQSTVFTYIIQFIQAFLQQPYTVH